MSKACPHCGGIIVKGRSSADHRRFFGVIRAAFDNWPDSHDFAPDSPEHLRCWLLCKAGYREVRTFELPEANPVMMARMMEFAETLMEHAGDGHRFGRWRGNVLSVFKPKSIAWDKLGQREFGAVRSAVEDVIKAETGLDPDKLLKEAEAAA